MTKVNWWMIAFIAAAVLWGFREGCGCRKGSGDVVGGPAPEPVYLPGVEKVIIDTQYVPEPKGVSKVAGSSHVKPDTVLLTDTVEVPVIVEVSEGTAYYRDSLPVSHGYAIIQDTVSENRITGRGFRLNQTLPIMKETVAEKKRNVVYLGVSGTGGKQNYFYSVSGDISLKDKRDRMYSVSGHLTVDNRFLIGAGVRWPVRLRK